MKQAGHEHRKVVYEDYLGISGGLERKRRRDEAKYTWTFCDSAK